MSEAKHEIPINCSFVNIFGRRETCCDMNTDINKAIVNDGALARADSGIKKKINIADTTINSGSSN